MIHQVLGNVGVCPTLPSEIRSSFPVSSGVQHRQKEHSTDGTKNEPVFDAAGQVMYYTFFSSKIFNHSMACLYEVGWPLCELAHLQLRSYIYGHSFVITMLCLHSRRAGPFCRDPVFSSTRIPPRTPGPRG